MDSSIKKGSISSAFSGTQSITSEKLNGKNYPNWSSAVEIWFLGQGLHDHLTTKPENVDASLRDAWQKIDYQLVPLLWQSIEPSLLVHYFPYKSCFEIWQNARTFYANDFQQLYDSVHNLATLQMHDHDLESYLNRAKSSIQQMKMILTSDDLQNQKIMARLDQMYMAFVLHGLHKDFENARNQVLSNPNMSTVEELVDKLSRVSATHESSRATLPTNAADLAVNAGDDHGTGVRVNQPQCSQFQQIGQIPDCSSFVHGVLVKSANVSPSQVVHFRSLDKPKEDDFCLEMSRLFTYDDVVERVAQQLGLDDPSKIRLTPHNCYYQQPKPQPIKYRGVEHLSDMLVHYNQMSNILYYEVLDIPLPELQGLKTLKVAFHHSTKDEVVIHTIRLPEQSTVGDVLDDLKTKVARDEDLAEQTGKDVYFDHNGLAENNHQPMKVVAQPDTGKAVESQPVEGPSSSRFTWRIDNFSRMNTKKLYSEIFISGGYKWRVLIFPKGNNVDYLSMYLDVADSASLPYGWSRYAEFSLAIVNQMPTKYSVRKDTQHQFNARESDWVFRPSCHFVSCMVLLEGILLMIRSWLKLIFLFIVLLIAGLMQNDH